MFSVRLTKLPRPFASERIVVVRKSLLRKISILTSCNRRHQIIADRVGTVFLDEHKWIDDVADALAHFCAAEIPPAVDEQLRHLIVRKSDRVQHDQPVNAVRGNENVFADDLQRRPFIAEI